MTSATVDPSRDNFRIPWREADTIVVFTGAGMSAESGVPTYRGSGGIWHRYNWQEYACQAAFDSDPASVLDFHARRRRAVLACLPHAGHEALAQMEKQHPDVTLVTQNIDGMHQRAGSQRVLELHGSLWRVRCPRHGVVEDLEQGDYANVKCPRCGAWMRPDIVWFGDAMNGEVMEEAAKAVTRCDLFVSVGTSGLVWPAAGFPHMAREAGAKLVEINPEPTPMSELYHHHVRQKARTALIERTAILLP